MPVSEGTTPFEYLQSIDRKCANFQSGLVQQESDVSVSHGLAFQLGKHKYILPIIDVSEVLSVKDYARIPRAPSWLVGIANVRGNLVTLIDLHDFIFSQAILGGYLSKRILLVKQDTHYYGLIIDSIIGMKSFNRDQGINEVPEGFNVKHIDHISAFYSSGEEWFASLSIQSLLLDDRFGELRKITQN
jgi:twitching motility protein PilI